MSAPKSIDEARACGYVQLPNGELAKLKRGSVRSAVVASLLEESKLPAPKAKAAKKPKLTQCEQNFWTILKARFPKAVITPQFRVRVSAWGAPVFVFYTADFLVSEEGYGDNFGYWLHRMFEVKDSRRKPHSDELLRPKLSREHNPWISCVTLATWDGKSWSERVIA